MSRRLFVALALATALAGLAITQGVTCPIDKSGTYFTGKTTTDKKTGKLLKEYKCHRNGHVFWVVAS